MDCRRNFSEEEILAGLKAGRTLNVDRRDAPELPFLIELERKGLVESVLKEIDDQSSVLKFRWKSSHPTSDPVGFTDEQVKS